MALSEDARVGVLIASIIVGFTALTVYVSNTACPFGEICHGAPSPAPPRTPTPSPALATFTPAPSPRPPVLTPSPVVAAPTPSPALATFTPAPVPMAPAPQQPTGGFLIVEDDGLVFTPANPPGTPCMFDWDCDSMVCNNGACE